jgi:hypothetical protein
VHSQALRLLAPPNSAAKRDRALPDASIAESPGVRITSQLIRASRAISLISAPTATSAKGRPDPFAAPFSYDRYLRTPVI